MALANTLLFSVAHNISVKNSVPINTIRFSVLLDKGRSGHWNSHVTSRLRACKCRCKVFKEDYLSEVYHGNTIVQSRIRAYHNGCDYSDGDDQKAVYDGEPNFYREFAAYLCRVWMESSLAEKYYEKAMEVEPCNRQLLREYAEFAWDELGNANKAEEIYEHAMQEYPQDVELVGSYALFLWKTDP